MSNTPGRPPTNTKEKKQLSSEARIIIALMKKQPLTKKEILDETKMGESTFYRYISLFEDHGIVKYVEQKYILWNFDPVETQIENAFNKLLSQPGIWYTTQNHIVNEIGVPWQKIETQTIKIANKLGLQIVPRPGNYRFYKPEIFQNQQAKNP